MRKTKGSKDVMTNFNPNKGKLFIVATPIGNLEDFTYRAHQILKSVDCILCEDTRHSRRLLQHWNIHTPLRAYHAHNEAHCSQQILKDIQEGITFALITDAGTPLMSDPGYTLVALLRSHHLSVIPIPGPCAFVAALSAAGLPTHSFIFEGFLSPKSAARLSKLQTLPHDQTLIFYEAPHRLLDFLQDAVMALGQHRKAVVARELTKIHETFLSGTLEQLVNCCQADPDQTRGEIVIMIAPKAAELEALSISTEIKNILLSCLAELPLARAVKLAAKITGINKNILYKEALNLQDG